MKSLIYQFGHPLISDFSDFQKKNKSGKNQKSKKGKGLTLNAVRMTPYVNGGHAGTRRCLFFSSFRGAFPKNKGRSLFRPRVRSPANLRRFGRVTQLNMSDTCRQRSSLARFAWVLQPCLSDSATKVIFRPFGRIVQLDRSDSVPTVELRILQWFWDALLLSCQIA